MGSAMGAAARNAVSSAEDFTVRNFGDAFNSNEYAYRSGLTDLNTHMTGGNSVFLGAHVWFEDFSDGDVNGVWPIVCCSDSSVGTQRYIRLQVQTDTGTPAFTDVRCQLNDNTGVRAVSETATLSTGQWIGVGTLVTQGASFWTTRVYSHPHGGSLEITLGSPSALSWSGGETVNLYSIGHHVFYNGAITNAHQFPGKIAAPVVVGNPTTQQITDYLAVGNPNSIWGSVFSQPDLSDWSERAGGADWTVIGTPATDGTLTLG